MSVQEETKKKKLVNTATISLGETFLIAKDRVSIAADITVKRMNSKSLFTFYIHGTMRSHFG